MRSLADAVRPGFEWALRLLAIGLLGWFLLTSIRAQRHGDVGYATSAGLGRALEHWSTVAVPERVHLELARPPSGLERDWLAALDGARTTVRWHGPSLLPTAVGMEPRADPAGGADVAVSAPPGATVTLRDELGIVDSAPAAAAGVRAYLPRPRATIDAVVGAVAARAAAHDSLVLKRLLVVGEAGWETKFTIAALEERGWKVDARVTVSPFAGATQGDVGAIDTAHYSAVLAIDTSASRYADRIVRYVRSGGGLVLWAGAARSLGFATVAPGAPGVVTEDDGEVPSDSAPRQALELQSIAALAPDAVPLERRGDEVAVAARRVGAGRVMETGYLDSWRWRMAGGDEAPAEHRGWLAALVARVAYTGRVARTPPPVDAAPLASLIDRLGPPDPEGAHAEGPDASFPARWVFTLICGALLLEWLSRRLRGVK